VSNKTQSSGQSETFLIMINVPKHDQHTRMYMSTYVRCENRFFIQSLMLLHSANIKIPLVTLSKHNGCHHWQSRAALKL